MATPAPLPSPATVAHTQRAWLVPVLLAMAASAVSQGFVRFTYAFVLPAMKDDLLGSYSAAGLLGAVNLGSYVVAVLAMTALASRVEGTLLVKLGLGGCVAGLLVVALAPNIWGLVAGMALAGSSSAAVWIPVSGIVAACAPAEKRGLAYGLMIMGIGLSIALSGSLTAVVHATRGVTMWREVWAAEAAISLLVLVLVTVGLKPVGTTSDVALRSIGSLRSEVAAVRICLAYGLYGVGFSIYIHFLIAALQELGGMTNGDANRAYSLLGIASIFGAVIVGRISDRWHRSHTLGLAMAVTGCCALVVTRTGSEWALTISVVVFGLAMTGIGVVLAAYLSDELAPADVATMFGVATLALAVAQFVAPPAGGWLADHTGSFTATYVVSAVASLVSGLIAWSLPSVSGRASRPSPGRS